MPRMPRVASVASVAPGRRLLLEYFVMFASSLSFTVISSPIHPIIITNNWRREEGVVSRQAIEALPFFVSLIVLLSLLRQHLQH